MVKFIVSTVEKQQELSQNGMKHVHKVMDIKVRLIAMFYGIDIKYVVNELITVKN